MFEVRASGHALSWAGRTNFGGALHLETLHAFDDSSA